MNATTAVRNSAKLDVGELMAAAEAATGMSDWGTDRTFRIGLDKLAESMNGMDAPEALVQQAGMRLTGSLMTRLHFVEDAKRHPEILDEKIERPLVIVGLPRTGTTITYDLLALDPAARAPRNWEFAMPWPAPEIATWDTDPRIAQLDAIFAHLLQGAPKLADIQDIEARACAECNLAFTHHFASTQFPAEWGMISYGKWLRENPAVPGRYATHKRLLQQLQWKGPRGRWTLKSPEHLCTIEELLEAFPGACLVWTHRDQVSAFSSLSSMLNEFRKAAGVKNDPIAVGRYVMDTWSTALEHATDVRDRKPEVDRTVIDISHQEVIADRVEVVKRIHRYFKLPFSAEHEAALHGAAMKTISRRFGKHTHEPADFGITREEVHSLLPKYLARFGHLFGEK
jgi:Sulfotransferase family